MPKIMKRLISIFAIICCAISCVGQKEDMVSLGLVLKPDRISVDVDGNMSVKFSVTNERVDVTNEAEIYLMSGGEPTERLDNMVFTPTEVGTYAFAAKYNDLYSTQVRVDAYSSEQGKSEGRDFFRRHLVLDFTGTWCVNCPHMTEALHHASQSDEFYDRVVEVAVHSIDEFEIAEGKALIDSWGFNSLPRVVVDADKSTEISAQDAEFIKQAMRKTKAYFAHPCGVKIDSSTEGDKLTIDAEVTITESGSYRIGALLLRDDVVAPQKNAPENYVHSSILTASLSGSITSGVELGSGSLNAGDVVTKSFTYELSKIADLDNTRIVIYVMTQHDGVNVVNNVAQCLAGLSAGYRYE